MIRALVLAFFLSACAAGQAEQGFAYIRTSGGRIETTNGVRYTVSAAGFRLVAPENRTDSFSHHPYEISHAGLFGDDQAVTVHAERVADASGASNYENLPVATWPSSAFRRRSMCAALAADDIRGEHDLEWLQSNGFNPAGALALEQSFATTPDHNQEIVISLVAKVASCDDAAAVTRALDALRQRVSVHRL